jgi:formylglycine-generating enzyme required for sulfatase activity
MSHSWSKDDFREAFGQWSKENQDSRIGQWIAKLAAQNQVVLYDAYVLDIYRRLHEIQGPATQWYRNLVEYLGFPWDTIHPVSREQCFLDALERVALLIERIESHGQTLKGAYRIWVKSPKRRFQLSEPPFTNTTGWTAEQLKARLDTILMMIEFKQADPRTQAWWDDWSKQSGRRDTEILRRAEEIRNRGATLGQAYRHFLADGHSDWKRTLLLLDADAEQAYWKKHGESNPQNVDAYWESLLALSDREDQIEIDERSEIQMREIFEDLSAKIGWPYEVPEDLICINLPNHKYTPLSDTWAQFWEKARGSEVGRHGVIRLAECLERHEIRYDTFIRYGAAETSTTALGQVYCAMLKTSLEHVVRKMRLAVLKMRLTVEYGVDSIGQFADLSAIATNTGQIVRQRMRWISPGTFMMGSPIGQVGRFSNEAQHQVTISGGFWMFDTPCTQGFWELVMGRNPSFFRDSQRPVEFVSWQDAENFAEQLNMCISEASWGRFRLPTEAEWEYACRAGTTGSTYIGDIEILGDANAPLLDRICWYGGNSGQDYDLIKSHSLERSWLTNRMYPDKVGGTRKVGQKEANAWGLYDMLGNVWEWCESLHEVSMQNLGYKFHLPQNSFLPVGRGGSYRDEAALCRSDSRCGYDPLDRYSFLGFRLLCSAAPTKSPEESEQGDSRSE